MPQRFLSRETWGKRRDQLGVEMRGGEHRDDSVLVPVCACSGWRGRLTTSLLQHHLPYVTKNLQELLARKTRRHFETVRQQ
jgi:hypothetical protein